MHTTEILEKGKTKISDLSVAEHHLRIVQKLLAVGLLRAQEAEQRMAALEEENRRLKASVEHYMGIVRKTNSELRSARDVNEQDRVYLTENELLSNALSDRDWEIQSLKRRLDQLKGQRHQFVNYSHTH